MELTLTEAASRLGVSVRQAQRLAQDGRLQVVRRVGRNVIVEDSGVLRRRRVSTQRGRRWNATTAWAAIDLLDHGRTDRITGSTLTRLKSRLGQVSVEEFARLAADRAETRRMTQTRRRAEALKQSLALTGRSALDDPSTAAHFGLAGGGTELVEGYSLRPELEALSLRFGLEADADGEVFLHLTDEDPVSSPITTALDLYERGTTRERSAAEKTLRAALDRYAGPGSTSTA